MTDSEVAVAAPVADAQSDGQEAGPTWQAGLPSYAFDSGARLIGQAPAPASPKGAVHGSFFRTARWSPDGSAILTVSEDRTARVYEHPTASQQEVDGLVKAWTPRQEHAYPSSILSTAWYPSASLANPGTFCYVVGTSDAPVRLVDGLSGKTRASYPIIDHVERFRAPSSMAFSPDASRLYCGHDTAIEVFDFNTPGSEATRLKLVPARRSKDGQKGLISALAFSTDPASGMYAAGSYTGQGSVCMYTEDTGERCVGELELGGAAGRGVTQIAFHPLNPAVVFVASRMSSFIGAYDIRNPLAGPFMVFERPGETQQRMDFSVDWAGRWLASGATDGSVKVWDISQGGDPTPSFNDKVHTDTVGSVSLHPLKAEIASCSGSRHLPEPADGEAYDSDSDSSTSVSSSSTASGSTTAAPADNTVSSWLKVHAFDRTS